MEVIVTTDYHDLDLQIRTPYFVLERGPNPKWRCSSRTSSDECILIYAKSGEAFYTIDGRNVTVGKGDVVFISMNNSRCARSNPEDPWSFCSTGFSVDFMDEESKRLFFSLPNVMKCSNTPELAADFAELNKVWAAKDKGYRLKCRSLILDIFYILLSDEERRRFSSAHFERISHIIDLMRGDLARNWSVAELSELSGLSESHFRMLFKQMTGYTTVRYQNHLRIDRAKDLLLSRSCNVTEAALAVGFSDVHYFSRIFKKLTGHNPSEYAHARFL